MSEQVLLIADVAEEGALVFLVEPHHAAGAAEIEHFGSGTHGTSSFGTWTVSPSLAATTARQEATNAVPPF